MSPEFVESTTFPEVGTEQERAGFNAVAAQAKLTRYGMDCYAYALVAMGQADLVIEAGLNAYDIQGPMAVIAAAGGIVTDWTGGPAHQGGRVLAAANATLHAEARCVRACAPCVTTQSAARAKWSSACFLSSWPSWTS